MPRSEGEEIARVHIWLFARDLERLAAIAGGMSDRSKLVRTIVRQFLDTAENKGNRNAKRIAAPADLDESISGSFTDKS